MPITYPPAAPSLSGDLLTISTFLNSPKLVARRIRELSDQRFISDVLLSARLTTDSGAVLYETGESIYSDRLPESVAPGAEYPLTTVGTGVPQLAKTEKWGQDSLVTDESISRQQMNPVERALTKQVNQLVKTIDGIAMSAIASAVTQTVAASAAWDTASPAILRDVLKVVAAISALNEGFEPDALVVDDLTWAVIASDPIITGQRAREDKSNPVYSGDFIEVGGLKLLRTPNLGLTKTALVVDTKQLGGMADEKIGGPGYVSTAGVGVEAKTIREDENDRWRLRARRVTVPIVLEPNAAYKITGVLT
jgi:hypothetical protein